MKRAVYLPLILFSILLLFSCSSSNNERLVGCWQLQTARYPSHEITTDSVFYSFDKGVFNLQTLSAEPNVYAQSTFGEYYLQEDSLIMKVAPSYMGSAIRGKYYDWKSAERRFAIQKIDCSTLIISVKDTLYTFRKYY